MSHALDDELAIKSAAEFTPHRIRDRALEQALYLCNGKYDESVMMDIEDDEKRAATVVAVARLFEGYLANG